MSPTWPADSPPDVAVLLPAAGRSERAGAGPPKQFRPIAGIPMLLRAVRPFARHPRVGQIVIALPAEIAADPPPWLAELSGERLSIVPGGDTRARSVGAALRALRPACHLVLVHDAARPFVSADTIDAVIAAAAAGTGAVAAIPVSDTLKRADGAGDRVAATVPRSALWRAQTPQGFPRDQIETAYRRWEQNGAGETTDDAEMVEAAGFPVRLIPDRTTNLKVTTPDDFVLAEAIAAR